MHTHTCRKMFSDMFVVFVVFFPVLFLGFLASWLLGFWAFWLDCLSDLSSCILGVPSPSLGFMCLFVAFLALALLLLQPFVRSCGLWQHLWLWRHRQLLFSNCACYLCNLCMYACLYVCTSSDIMEAEPPQSPRLCIFKYHGAGGLACPPLSCLLLCFFGGSRAPFAELAFEHHWRWAAAPS